MQGVVACQRCVKSAKRVKMCPCLHVIEEHNFENWQKLGPAEATEALNALVCAHQHALLPCLCMPTPEILSLETSQMSEATLWHRACKVWGSACSAAQRFAFW